MCRQNKILRDIIARYGSTSDPNWSFAAKRYSRTPYGNLVLQLKQFAKVVDTTDLNVDVSLVLFISCSDEPGFCLRLSLVGSYACISSEQGVFFPCDELIRNGAVKKASQMLSENNIELLTSEELHQSIDFENEQRPLYSVLFSADEAID